MSRWSSLIVTVLVLNVAAQDVDLTGKVTNASSGSPLSSAIVTLKNRPEVADTTAADGTYRLRTAVRVSRNPAGQVPSSGCWLRNGLLQISVTNREPVTVETYSLNGVLRARLLDDKMIAPGRYSFDIGTATTGTALFVVRVRQGDRTTSYPAIPLGAAFTNANSVDRQSGGLAKSAAFDDTIICSLGGFTAARIAVTAATGVNDIALQPLGQTVTDIDGNVYHTVTIGTQVWMVENLKTTRYNDGSAIPMVNKGNDWFFCHTPAYCWYNDDSAANKSTYGAIYNWFAMSTGKLAPTGWHIPTDAEWSTLTTYLGGESVAGGKLKEAGTTHWVSPNAGAGNATGFTALPGGYINDYGSFYAIGTNGYWWSSTGGASNSITRVMTYDYASVDSHGADSGVYGFSVRCIRD